MPLGPKSGLAIMSAGRASGFRLVKEQIVLNRRKSRHGTRENMAKLCCTRNKNLTIKIPAITIPRPAEYMYISASSWKDDGQLVPCSFSWSLDFSVFGM